MNRLVAVSKFAWEFVVGDDWRIAVSVVLALAATALLSHHTGVGAWWLLPPVVALRLALSVVAVARGGQP